MPFLTKTQILCSQNKGLCVHKHTICSWPNDVNIDQFSVRRSLRRLKKQKPMQ